MRRIGRIATLLSTLTVRAAIAQAPPPIADKIDQPLLPSGISEFPVELSGKLVFLFKTADGASAMHFIGDFSLRSGDPEAQEFRSREAVVWVMDRTFEQRDYRHLQMFLWQDAEVREVAGTVTSGPALFVTLSTFGAVSASADEVAMQSSAETQAYQEGERIRSAFAGAQVFGPDATAPLRVFDPTGLGATAKKPTVRPVIHFQTTGEMTVSETVDGGKVIAVTGGVYLARGTAESDQFIQVQADNAVVFLAPGQDLQIPVSGEAAGLGQGESAAVPVSRARDGRSPRDKSRRSDSQLLASGFGDVEVEGAYLEGDVQFTQGPHMIRATRLYYDFQRDRALILDAVARTLLVERNIPLYVRASEIRQLSANEFMAENALVTTSEFHTPHYHVGASRVSLINTTPADLRGRSTGLVSGTFSINDATLNLGGRPVLWWPFVRGNVDTSETAIRSLRMGYSGDFGAELETKWHLFNLLGLETPEGFDSTLNLDFYSERGPAIGVDADYVRDRYFGEIKSYLLGDRGEDDLGRDREEPSEHDVRGRLLFRHRQYLEEGWQVSLELSFLSDRHFLEEFFKPEFENEKDQETLLYLKKQRDNWAFTALLQTRILDFLTQTERYPDLAYFRFGDRLADSATWYSENRIGMVRYRAGDRTIREFLQDVLSGESDDRFRGGRTRSSGVTGRGDTRQELDAPFDLGPWRFVPFITGRGSAWDDSPDDGSVGRIFGSAGVRGTMYLSKTDPDIRSELFDIDGIHHVVKAQIVAWVAGSNRDSHELFPFDETVEGIHDAGGAEFGIRQRWQTKRGEGANRRSVDLLTHDLKIGAFDNANGDVVTNGFTSFSRPENSIPRNYANSSTIWRVNDRTALLSEANYDLNDGKLDILNVAVAVERTPRFSYLIGYRFIDHTDSNLLGFDMNYRMTEKHTIAFRELFDLDRGRTLDFTVGLIRKHPRWYSALSFELNESEDDFGVSLSIWPEGLPQAALGSRRFTGLATSTHLQGD